MTTVSWLGGSGDWSSNNWSGGVAPSGNNVTIDVVINTGSVALGTGFVDVNSITIGLGASLSVDGFVAGANIGTPTLGVGGTNNAGDIEINHSSANVAELDNTGTFGVHNGASAVFSQVTNEGTLDVDNVAGEGGSALSVDGTFTNNNNVQIGNTTPSAVTNFTYDSLVNNTGATLKVDGSSAHVAQMSLMGGSISNAGDLELTFADMSFGGDLENSGTIGLHDSTASLSSAFTNTGTIDIDVPSAGQSVLKTEGLDDTGTITVDGPGASLSSTTGTSIVGDAESGSVSVTDGASFSNVRLDVGKQAGETGTVSIDGAGSSFSAGTLIVGDAGAGTLSVTNGAKFSVGNVEVAAQAGSAGQLLLGDGAYTVSSGAGQATITLGNGDDHVSIGAGAAVVTLGDGDDTVFSGAGASHITLGQGADSVTLTDAAAFTGSISGFAGGDTLDLTNVSGVTAAAWANGVLTLTAAGGAIDLNLPGNYANTQFYFAADGNGGTAISLGPTIVDYLDASELAYDLTLSNTPSAFSSGVAAGLSALGFMAINVPGNTSSTGMAAIAFADPETKQIIVAFRGTVVSLTNPLTSFQDLVTIDGVGTFGADPSVMSPVFAAALSFVKSVESANPGYQIFVTGHSLGGTEAEAVASALTATPGAYPDPFDGGVTFASAGITKLLAGWTGQATTSIVNNLTDFVITNDPAATYSTDSVGQVVGGPGAHVGTIVPLSPTATATPGAIATFFADLFSNNFLSGGLSGLLADKNINMAQALLGLPQHAIANYGEALADAGYISANPLAAGATAPLSTGAADLGSLFTSIQNLAAGADSAGDIVQTGFLKVATSLGEAVVNLAETVTQAGSIIFSMVVQSGENIASQVLDWSSDGAVSDAITIDGTRVETPDISAGDPASLNIGADGSIIVGVGAPTAGDEITVVDSPSGTATVFTGGDASVAADQIDQLALAPNDALHIGAAGGAESPTVTLSLSPAAIDDFSGGGTSGILFGQADGTLAEWLMSGTSITGGGEVGDPGGTWAEVGTGDFYGVGTSDILFQDAFDNLALWEMEGPTIVGGGNVGNPGGTWRAVGVGDFSGDGLAGVLFADAGGNLAIWEMNGTSIIGGGAIGGPGGSWAVKGVGDFNGDGKSDILFEDASGNYAIWEMSGTTIIGGGAIGNPGAGWTEKGIGDFNGDGKSDILFEDAAGDYAIWEMNGTSIIGGGDIGNPGGTWQFAGIGDYTGDGTSDILFEDGSGNLAIWEMNGTAIVGGGAIGNPGSIWHVLG